MRFEVDVITTLVKTIPVNASDNDRAKAIVKSMNVKGNLQEATTRVAGHKYKIRCVCDNCGKKTSIFFTEGNAGYCTPCYSKYVERIKAVI